MKEFFRTSNQIRGLTDMLEKLPDNMTAIEVGSAYGESATVFMDSGKFIKLYCVDPWIGSMSEREKHFDERHSEDERVIKIKKKSGDALEDVPVVDFVYIDACHSYLDVLKDIQNYRKKVKKSGFIAGHDYTYKFKDDVIRAVDEELNRPDYVFRDGSWLKQLC